MAIGKRQPFLKKQKTIKYKLKIKEVNLMKNDKIKRVEEMEKIMDKSADIFRELNMVLDKLEENLSDYKKLDEYYSSENWFLDVEDFNNGILPQDLKCGVLSEDGAYNLFGENHELAIRMVEIAAKMLRR